MPFAFLQHLIAEDLPDFNAFINSVGYSRVTCLRYLRPLRDLAKQLGLRIVYENIQIIGDEDRVRIFLTLMYWSATDGVEWPFVNCSRTQASLFARQADSEFKLEYHSPVLQELLAYFVAVTQSRVAHHHQFSELVTMIADPVANLFKKNRELTWPEQISESQHLFLVSFLLPIYYTPGDPRLRVVIGRFERFSPKAFALAKAIIGNLQSDVLPTQTTNPQYGDVILASTLAVVVSVMTLGFDLGSTIAYAFKPEMSAVKPDSRLQQAVTQATAKAITEADIEAHGDLLLDMSTALYVNLLQLRQITHPAKRLKVALLLEPVAVGYMDLLLFLDQQPYIEFVHDHFETADLIIKDSALPLVLDQQKRPVIFQWDLNASGELFGELFYLIRSMQRKLAG
ncbi:helix-turn-helix domain-containing protein [Lacticaseibacillus baoqingensis]|uniref:Helix-turn-helix domain-containing protein n=1 Tax=Lacticaseibacillus baoqingensis TaxID=2486013 RepID=A0ABW4E855_9LACO|nr:helix-turn-helix domain-containing protein [Lacticaseibacillus baoqingensis]